MAARSTAGSSRVRGLRPTMCATAARPPAGRGPQRGADRGDVGMQAALGEQRAGGEHQRGPRQPARQQVPQRALEKPGSRHGHADEHQDGRDAGGPARPRRVALAVQPCVQLANEPAHPDNGVAHHAERRVGVAERGLRQERAPGQARLDRKTLGREIESPEGRRHGGER